MVDIYFWRQFLILSSALLYGLSSGIVFAFPSVLIPAIIGSAEVEATGNRREHATWITAFNGVGGLAGAFIISLIFHLFGRKLAYFTMNTCMLTGFLVFTFASNVTALYAARFIQGISSGIMGTIVIIGEYVHPRRRGYFITLIKVSTGVGYLCCHSMSAFWTWRQIATFTIVPNSAAIILLCFWPESPMYLASKGRFERCEKSYKWLNGKSDESQKQLKSLINSQREKIASRNVTHNRITELARTFLKKDFRKALLINFVLFLGIDACGQHYNTVFLIQIMTEILDSKSSALYFIIGTDILLIISLSMSAIIVRKFRRRAIFIKFGSLAVIFLTSISGILYIKSFLFLNSIYLKYVMWMTTALILLQYITVNIGVIPVFTVLLSEIYPLEHKGLGNFMFCLMLNLLLATTLKIVPYLMEHTKLYGTYGIFGLTLAFCILILYVILPETKDKPLHEIENEICGVTSRDENLLAKKELDDLNDKP